jgi:hypothetical protein
MMIRDHSVRRKSHDSCERQRLRCTWTRDEPHRNRKRVKAPGSVSFHQLHGGCSQGGPCQQTDQFSTQFATTTLANINITSIITKIVIIIITINDIVVVIAAVSQIVKRFSTLVLLVLVLVLMMIVVELSPCLPQVGQGMFVAATTMLRQGLLQVSDFFGFGSQ